MIVAGKSEPVEEELEKVSQMGFRNVELYLEKRHLDDMDETVKACRNSDLNVASVHTPHVSMKESKYFLKADRLAEKLDAYLVLHSQHLHHVHIPELERLGLESGYGYENNPGISLYHLENLVLAQGHELVLDTAHLFMATESFQEDLRALLDSYPDRIQVIHLCDSTRWEDGLGFGNGEMDMDRTIENIRNSGFSGEVVLEVMPDHQEDALEKWRILS